MRGNFSCPSTAESLMSKMPSMLRRFIEWQEGKKDVNADVLLAELACVWLWSVTYLLTAIVVCELRGT